MPEGDSLFHVAEKLRPALLGKEVRFLELPRSPVSALAAGRRDFMVGQRIEKVESKGKNLLIHFANEWLLHTHLQMNGSWRLFSDGDPRARRAGASVVLEVDGFVAICREAPVARLLRPGSLVRDRNLSTLGPDLCGETFDAAEALRRLSLRKRAPLGVAIMDQRVLSGIGNVYKSEICFNRRMDPFSLVGSFTEDELSQLIAHAREVLLYNIAPRTRGGFHKPHRVTRPSYRPGRPDQSVYGRSGMPCFDCGTTIEMKRQGEALRSTYYCRTCQPPRAPSDKAIVVP